MPPEPVPDSIYDIEEITMEPAEAPGALIELEETLFPGPQENRAGNVRWAFRGQQQAFGTLVPSLQRIFKTKRWAGAVELIERDLIKTFRQHYATLRGRTPDMPDLSLIGPGYDLRCLSVMQHYGVPSRLLDWTSHFWTAIYFACAGDPLKDAELWIYDRDIFNDQVNLRPELRSLLQPAAGSAGGTEPDLLSQRNSQLIAELDPRLTPRMKEQMAHHTFTSDVFADHGPLLFKLAQKRDGLNTPVTSFRRVLITPKCKQSALRFLQEQKGVTAGTIFPDVEGLGKFLHWHLESLVTTLV